VCKVWMMAILSVAALGLVACSEAPNAPDEEAMMTEIPEEEEIGADEAADTSATAYSENEIVGQ
jgi:predicted outer membrane protein